MSPDSMNNPPEDAQSRPAGDAADPPLPARDAPDRDPPRSAPAPAASATRAEPPRWRRPSLRVTAVLAASMLAVGVVVGAAIGPAPSPSFAVNRLLPSLLPSLLGGERHTGVPASPSPAASSSEGEVETSTTRHRRRRKRKALEAEASSAAEAAPSASEETTPAASSPTATSKAKPATLPDVSKVWLIELSGGGFSEASASPSTAHYTDTTALGEGTLLEGWSALQANAFATDAALIAGTSPQLVDTIVQPPCPEGAVGASCAPGTPGALRAADEFLQATLPTITSTPVYKENGLVVVTFASVATAAATGLPAGAATATLTSQPPAGVLLISPFVAAGTKSSATLDTSSPQQTLEKLLRR